MVQENEVDRKIFHHGDVVYFVDEGRVKVGVFDEMFAEHGYAYVDLIELAEHRYVDGVPIDDFHSETEWRKLPKGWTYNTELFRLEERVPEKEQARRKELFLTNRADVETGLLEGLLVLARTKFHGVVEAEIDKHLGFRIIKRYPHWTVTYGQKNRDYRRVPIKDLFLTFDGASMRLRSINDEKEKELSLSDDEWSRKEIEKVLARTDPQYREKCILFINSLTDIWDVEVELRDGKAYWRRFEKRTPWEPIDEDPVIESKYRLIEGARGIKSYYVFYKKARRYEFMLPDFNFCSQALTHIEMLATARTVIEQNIEEIASRTGNVPIPMGIQDAKDIVDLAKYDTVAAVSVSVPAVVYADND